MPPNVPISDTGTTTEATKPARTERRKAKVGYRLHVDIVGQRRLQLGQQRLDLVHRLDDVGIGLQVNDHQHRALAVGLALVADVLGRIDHLGDVRQAYRRTIAPGNDEIAIFGGGARLVVGVELIAPFTDLERALG
jgi:hypothetical protein